METREHAYPSLFVLVRHGESARNALKRGKLEVPDTPEARRLAELHDYQIPLSPLGEQQAAAVGAFLRSRSLSFDKCYDSGYQRARDTRRIALERAYPPEQIAAMAVRSELLLREREAGILHNMTAEDVAANPLLGCWVDEFKRNPFQTKYPGGESLADVVDRVRHFRDWASDRHPGERILVFCHGLVMKAFRIVLLHFDIGAALELALASPIPNCGVHIYRRASTGWAFEEYAPAAGVVAPS
jgi:broad specificity phosphatase PhoE